jgi:hypothetical protein
MPVVEDLITYLDPLIAEAAGVDLVEGPMPELPDNCVALTATGGEVAEYTMGGELAPTDLEYSHVQMMVRNTLMASSISRAMAIHALLNNLGRRTINGRTYHHVRAMDGEPHSLGQDQNARWRRVVNYRVYKAAG